MLLMLSNESMSHVLRETRDENHSLVYHVARSKLPPLILKEFEVYDAAMYDRYGYHPIAFED